MTSVQTNDRTRPENQPLTNDQLGSMANHFLNTFTLNKVDPPNAMTVLCLAMSVVYATGFKNLSVEEFSETVRNSVKVAVGALQMETIQ